MSLKMKRYRYYIYVTITRYLDRFRAWQDFGNIILINYFLYFQMLSFLSVTLHIRMITFITYCIYYFRIGYTSVVLEFIDIMLLSIFHDEKRDGKTLCLFLIGATLELQTFARRTEFLVFLKMINRANRVSSSREKFLLFV